MRLLPDGQYPVIAVDPPWGFATFSNKSGVIPQRHKVQHYGVMSLAEMKAMDVQSVAAKDCALCMWCLDSMLLHALELGKAWGFEYKCVLFVWNKQTKNGKPTMGMGYYSRKGAELCLLFTRGKPKRVSRGVRQVITASVREHSRKPDLFYERVTELFAGPYLELFARSPRTGWTVWGNETEKFSEGEPGAANASLPATLPVLPEPTTKPEGLATNGER